MVSLAIAVGLVGSGLGNIWSANAQQTDQKTDMKMKPGTKMEMKPGTKMEMKPGTKMEMTTTGIFDGVGKIIALVPEQSQVVVGHEEIKGFMKAMPHKPPYSVTLGCNSSFRIVRRRASVPVSSSPIIRE